MKKRNQTERLLFTSLAAIVLCVVTLAGTTYAWFFATLGSKLSCAAIPLADENEGAQIRRSLETLSANRQKWDYLTSLAGEKGVRICDGLENAAVILCGGDAEYLSQLVDPSLQARTLPFPLTLFGVSLAASYAPRHQQCLE